MQNVSERNATQQHLVAMLWLLALAPRTRDDLEAMGHTRWQQDAACVTGLIHIDDRPESFRGNRAGTPAVGITDQGRQVLTDVTTTGATTP